MFLINQEYDKETNTITFNFVGTFHEDYRQTFAKFFELYEMDNFIYHPEEETTLQLAKERICIFCGETNPKKFKKNAHIIPQFMGNKNLLSNNECDTCNLLFGRYEDQFTKFMGITRTMTFLKGQEGLPKFKTPDKNLIVGEDKESPESKKIRLESHGLNNDHLNINHPNNTFSVNAIKHPYNPIKAFKTLLKIGYSLLPEEERKDYDQLLAILMTDQYDDKLTGNPCFHIFGALCPGPALRAVPFMYMFKKKENKNEENIPSRTLVLHFQNYIYQFFLPFSRQDEAIIVKQKKVSLQRAPIFLDKYWIDNFGTPQLFLENMGKNETIRNETQNITMSFMNATYIEVFPVQHRIYRRDHSLNLNGDLMWFNYR